MTRRYDSLVVCALTPEMHEGTCNYWYTVTNGAMAHTAFETRAGLNRWLSERNLKLESELPVELGEYGRSRIIGAYQTRSYLYDADEFEALLRSCQGRANDPVRTDRPIVTVTMDNADYTLALIDEDSTGERTVHYLNPNVRTRLVFDYWHTREQMR